jgi:hypothetical protein
MMPAVVDRDTPATLWSRRPLLLSAWCLIAAFGTYFCMYAFRKPFTAATYTDTMLLGIDYKTVLVTAQVLGYTLSKFLGIKVIAEMQARWRAVTILGFIGVAHVALLLFGLTPPPFNWIWLFLNGLPLGMVFGLVLGFLEGRRQTDALAAGLCVSFIIADGVTKSVGAALVAAGVSPYWMPFSAGLLFVPPLLFFVWMLTRIPAPSSDDVSARSQRMPMDWQERRRLFRHYAVGLVLVVVAYLLCTILRSVRADFAQEIWTGLGTTDQPGIFTESEMAVAAGVLVLVGATVVIGDNRKAFFAALALATAGLILVAAALVGLRTAMLSPFIFMVLHGLGLYLPYIVVQTTLFERLLAMTRERGNMGYLVYLADAFGYLGYVGVMLARSVWAEQEGFLSFFITISWVVAGAAALATLGSWYYFAKHSDAHHPPHL